MKTQSYIRGLDGLRCIGTLIILFYHIERAKSLFDLPSFSKHQQTGVGQSVMTLFFVLSGFLIFYLLLNEKAASGTVSVKSFYKRRIARIWPVYYVLVFASVFVFEYHKEFFSSQSLHHTKDYMNVVILYVLHMPNFHIFFTSSLLAIGHFWSLGVEEQFYAIAPWIIKKTKNYVRVFVIIIVAKMGFKLLVACSYRFLPLSAEAVEFLKDLERFLYKLRFEAFALGGIAAYLFVEQKQNVLNFIYRPSVQWMNLLLFILTVPLGTRSESIQILYALNFAIMILNIVGNKRSVFLPDYKLTNYIGKISYGVYMYQIPVIYLTVNVLKSYYSPANSVIWNIAYYSATVCFPIIIASVSYELMEKRIIRWSHR